MSTYRPIYRKTRTITQNPDDARRWILLLECGHKEFFTSDRKPFIIKVFCSKCTEEAYGERQETFYDKHNPS